MDVFSKNQQYYLDFYQRDYQWKQVHVDKLLEDLLYRFKLEYKPEMDITPEAIDNFDWYYLNAYVTNGYKGKTYIVDGQQRLTTLTLILIKLYHLTQAFKSEKADVIKEQILGAGLTGHTYWMGEGNRKPALEDLFNNGFQTLDIENDDISIVNIYENYKAVDKNLTSALPDLHILDAFIFYILTRVLLVNIEIQDTKDVPMVFEVINDRGERLKPYEVLKGKLLGQIGKEEIEPYYDIWQGHIHSLQKLSDRDVDEFFRFYFRAKYVDNRTDWRDFDGDYQKKIYEEKWNKKIHLKQNPKQVKHFIKKELDYFSSLYYKIRLGAGDPKKYPYLYFNNLNDLDRQYLVVLSACKTDDPKEDQKIELVSRLLDRNFTLLQLMGAYDSNQFTESITELNKNIRNKSLEEIPAIFEQQLLEDISEVKGTTVSTPFEWMYFSSASRINLPYRFIKYFFARIDHFISNGIGKTAEPYDELMLRTGPVNGYHIEHILAFNEENLALFDHDEEIFNVERNRLGAILLLQGRDNFASQNESFLGKRKIYASRSIYWNKTLAPEFYHNHPNFKDFAAKHGLPFVSYDVFDGKAVRERQQLLFELVKIIWA